MEEEVGVKVTRLRRRLSVEAEDVKSPSTQSTPTKKRGGRLAAKPQLELIDENATEVDKPKRTRKSAVRDAEPEERAITPSRRSTRIRSNTSIVSETPLEAEDKGTPSRRTTRIKSNTSIVAEMTQHVDSPRAKRAARRTSQVGSDNEAPITPGRSTRRTRKDSTSSIDKQAELDKLEPQVKEVIIEEAENNIKDSRSNVTSAKDTNESATTRKSPRLIGKTSKTSSPDHENKCEPESVKESNDEKSDSADASIVSSLKKIPKSDKDPEEINLSVSSSNLIKQLESEPKKGNAYLNKTTSTVEEAQSKLKRRRTKSWTTITLNPSNDSNFLSDTEATRKKYKIKSNATNESGSGEGVLNTSNKSITKTEEQYDIRDISLNSSITSDKKKKKRNDKSILADETKVPIINTLAGLDKSVTVDRDLSPQTEEPNFTEKFFCKAPSGAIQSLVYIEDSDSNTGTGEKGNVLQEIESGDQCVPVVKHQLAEQISKEAKNNHSYEPMDIDETMPENVSLSVFTDKNTSAIKDGVQKRQSLQNISLTDNVNIDTNNKSNRKSTISDLENDNEVTPNKSKKKALIVAASCNDPTIIHITKSKRKSILSTEEVDDKAEDNSSNPGDNIINSLNKSKRKSNFVTSDDKDKNSFSSSCYDDSMNKSAAKLKRKSTIMENNIDEDKNKSNRKSSISYVDNEDNIIGKSKRNHDAPSDINDIHIDNDLNIDMHDDHMIKSSNRSERNSIVVNAKKGNKSNRKSSSSNVDSDENIDASKKNFKIKSPSSKVHTDDDVDNDGAMESIDSKCISITLNDVNVNESVTKTDVDNKNESVMNESYNKTKKRSAVSDADHDKSTRKSSFSTITDNDEVDSGFNKSNNYDDNSNLGSNKSKRKSSNTSENNVDDKFTKSEKESTVSDLFNCGMNKSSDKSKRTSSISKIDVEDSIDSVLHKSCNKSKRKSSISDVESQIFEKSNKEDKSTLILSQIRDVSETSVPKELYESNESKDSNEQLSKSINMPNVIKDKESKKKNVSLTYSTSTPLQQKPLKKLGMQMNSSIITPNNNTKMKNNSSLGRSKKDTSDLSQNGASEPSDEEDEESSEEDIGESSEEESVYRSKMIDNEAEEASEDYESGDSIDEDAKEYEEQHEIIEKGETLDSEDEDFSDDSEYEKGSFVVDSDEDDAELLSGSGDDLSMSADELNMSAKSKRKFNERQIKAQKKASREMFEARHKLNKSDNRANYNKKVNRQRLESSESEAEVKVCTQPKKNKRARIDSSQEITITHSDLDTTKLKPKKISRKLSDSVCEENTANEKEISVYENNETAKDDPLSLHNIVKEEPKTPQKDLNTSTASISNIEVEEVNIENNISIMKSNQTTDPLQTTSAEDEAMDDGSEESISENEEITQNYESILNDLNKKSNKVKSLQLSFNIHKNTKQKNKEPIIDELNLTQTKKLKRRKQDSTLVSDLKKVEKDKSLNNKIMEKVNKSLNIQEEGSSDSIDMKLLFNDDSTDSEIKVSTQKENIASAEEFIPLKRTEGKTNILEKTDSACKGPNESVLNNSKSKKLKHTSCLPEETVDDEQNDGNINFFIDTTGTHTDIDKSVDTSLRSSAKKNKRKNNVSVTNVEKGKSDDDSNDAPLQVSYQSDKNKDKSKQDLNTSHTGENKIVSPGSKTPVSSKKNKKSLDNLEIIEHTGDDSNDAPLQVSYQSHKNKDKSVQDLDTTHTGKKNIVTPGSKTPVSVKKNKKSLDNSQIIEYTEVKTIIAEEDTLKKRKRKPSANQSIEETTRKEEAKILDGPEVLIESLVTINQKKKRKISHTIYKENLEEKVTDATSEKQEPLALSKPKKKSKTAEEQKPVQNNDDSTKKSKKRKVRDDDVGEKLSKVIKQNSLDKVHVPRLPTNVLKQLDDYPEKYESKDKIVSTTTFKVEETKKRRNKPSNYLEQSVYLNDSKEEQTKNKTVKAPKVLPFIPTATTSDYGFTTNFKVNVIQETQFVAQSSDMYNFKQDYLQKNRIKKLGTFEKYKRHRTIKISKF